MRKILPALICMTCAVRSAIAATDTPVFIASCPTCDCDNKKEATARNSYAGVRIYQNVRARYAYSAADTPPIKRERDNLGFGTTMGFRFCDWLRGEYETLYMGAEYTAGNQNFQYDIWANMLNLYLYHDIEHAVAPYVGVGAGLTAMWGAIDGHLNNATQISGQALVGVLFEITPAIELEAGFKYIYFGKIEHAVGQTRVTAAQFYLGAIYRF